MTVRELIAILQALPQDLQAYRDDCEWGPAIRVSGVHVPKSKVNPFNPDAPRPEKAAVIR